MTVGVDTTLEEVAEILAKNDVTGVPIGVVSASDLQPLRIGAGDPSHGGGGRYWARVNGSDLADRATQRR